METEGDDDGRTLETPFEKLFWANRELVLGFKAALQILSLPLQSHGDWKHPPRCRGIWTKRAPKSRIIHGRRNSIRMVSYVASSNKLPIEFGRKFAWQTQYEERVGSPMRTMRENLQRMESVREKQRQSVAEVTFVQDLPRERERERVARRKTRHPSDLLSASAEWVNTVSANTCTTSTKCLGFFDPHCLILASYQYY